MNKFLHLFQFVQGLFDDRHYSKGNTDFENTFPRIGDIARGMRGNATANYK
ncbi:MAG: hypothetical protein HPY45_04330 [Anaerolineae bacterium]|nr:hypothetical protein [Anaerolineae bacterium]